MNIIKNLSLIKEKIPASVTLVAVSKTKPNELIMDAYDAGHKIFGENKIQDLAKKYEDLPKDIQWHFIGHLQTNKVKYISSFVHLIHAVDSLKLLKTINKEAKKHNRKIAVLLQIRIATEDTKFGMNEDELEQLLINDEFILLNNIQITGLMGMATNTDDENQIKREFSLLKTIFNQTKNNYFVDIPVFKEISMGMSSDYKTAIQQGSTMVRIGSSIFGARN